MPICLQVDQLHKASLEFLMLRMNGYDVFPSNELINSQYISTSNYIPTIPI